MPFACFEFVLSFLRFFLENLSNLRKPDYDIITFPFQGLDPKFTREN
jgi:hypothetical protein